MCITIYPSFAEGKITVPPSKSYMQRALIAGLLTRGVTRIKNPGYSNDDISMQKAIQKMGADICEDENQMILQGELNLKDTKISAGESGLGIRLLTPTAALFDKKIILTGEGSLLNRPMDVMEKAIGQLGAVCKTENGYLPIRIKGPLQGGEIELDGAMSSQFLSGLLFALPLAPNDSVIHIHNLKSKPYVDLTIDTLKQHGIHIKNENYQTFSIRGNQNYTPCNHTMEGDWSNGAFWLVAGAINGSLEIHGLNPDSLQGDKKILEALEKSGANITVKKTHYKAEKTTGLKAFQFDASDTPDLFPPLVTLAAHCKGTSTIKGVTRLLHKESNRKESLTREFSIMGIQIHSPDEDTLEVTGGSPGGGEVHSHNDHRIAMACAVTGLNAKNTTHIRNHQAVNKSYPGFFRDLKSINVNTQKSNKI